MTDRDYLTCTETAKLLRAHLKRAFPGVKFSVRSDSYAGGASIHVRWVDGPTEHEVDKVARRYAGARFDGMIDMKTHADHWLEDDGTVSLAHDPGTERSRGSNPERIGSRRTPGARLVSLGADYVFTDRSFSPEFLARRSESAEEVRTTPGDTQCIVCRMNIGATSYLVRFRGYGGSGSPRNELACSRKCAGRLSAESTRAAT